MTLRRVTEASVFPVTIDEVKAQCRVDFSDDDTLLGFYIQTANEAIGEDAGMVLGAEEWELTVSDLLPDDEVTLTPIPVSGLVSVNGDTDVSGYTLSIDGDCATVTGAWPEGDVVIVFSVGGAAPVGLKHAMLMLIGHWYENRSGTSEGAVMEIPYAVESLVARHRRGWVKA